MEDVNDKKIDVLRIRLWNAQRATALMAEFHRADAVLAQWARCSDSHPVSFEVTFLDGYVVEGSHQFYREGKRKCLFSTHVRRLLSVVHMPDVPLDGSARANARYLIA